MKIEQRLTKTNKKPFYVFEFKDQEDANTTLSLIEEFGIEHKNKEVNAIAKKLRAAYTEKYPQGEYKVSTCIFPEDFITLFLIFMEESTKAEGSKDARELNKDICDQYVKAMTLVTDLAKKNHELIKENETLAALSEFL